MLVQLRDARGATVSACAKTNAPDVYVVVVNGHSILVRLVDVDEGADEGEADEGEIDQRYRVHCETCDASVSEDTSSPQRDITRHVAFVPGARQDPRGWGN